MVVDRGLTDFSLFRRWTDEGVYFVTRQKFNAAYQIVERRNVPENRGVLSDEVIRFTGPKTKHDCPHLLRRIVYQDKETGKKLVFLTNHLDFGATTIASIYKDRWQIELFFKALKQNLKVKNLRGHQPQRLEDSDLDSTDRHAIAEIPSAPLALKLGPLEPGRAAALEFIHLP